MGSTFNRVKMVGNYFALGNGVKGKGRKEGYYT